LVRKKTEGNEQQRRCASRDARARGGEPSAAHATTGASKQPSHRQGGASHDERIEDLHAGKQQPSGSAPWPHSVKEREPSRKR
jgi:hypothetical protein